MSEDAAIRLPGGLWLDGRRHRDAVLRPLTGVDEEVLAEAGSRAARVSRLLARCVERVGAVEMSAAVAGQLTVGDREALLLHLRRLTLGPRLQCVAECAACGTAADLELSVEDLLHPPYTEWEPEYETRCATPRGELRVRFRLPTGSDLIAAAAAAARGEAAEPLLLRRCLLALHPAEARHPDDGDVEAALLQVLPALMAARDAQAETVLDFVCPLCGAAGEVLFDAADFLFRELGVDRDGLYRQVHRLASRYHWSETDILALPWTKRQRYLALLDEGAA